jgi:hypothetical protein
MNGTTIAHYKNCLFYCKKRILEQCTERGATEAQLPHFRDDKLDEVFRHYDKYEQFIKGKMPPSDPLDQHKQAAALCCAVLKTRLFETILTPPVLDNPYINNANEYCASSMGLKVMQDVWVSWAIDDSLPMHERQIFNNLIDLPPSHNPDNATYADWFVKLLKKDTVGGVFGNYFDYENPHFAIKRVFFLSNIYYLIECCSYQYYRAEIAIRNSQPAAQAVTGAAV